MYWILKENNGPISNGRLYSRTLFTRESHGSIKGVCCGIDRTVKRFWEVKNCGVQIDD